MIPSNGRPRRAPRLAVAALCVAGLLAGCGGSSGDAKAGDGGTTETTSAVPPAVSVPADLPQKAACGMITVGEVEAAIGTKVGPAKEETRPGRSMCSFTLVSKPDESIVLISTSSTGVPAFFATAFNTANAPQAVTAGDQAFVSGAQGLVRRGNTMVAILVVLRQPPAQIQAAATKLTQAVGTHI
ncbi:MAG TPA: hypothetical protein VFK43_02770 [Acidimicrobiales bacterium]|nr:hypothetical protein [Acidimicrobiales bacterium]